MKKVKIASLVDYFEVIVKWRVFIAKNVLGITLIAIIIAFLLPERFTATATILPPSAEQQSMLGIMSSFMQGGLSNLSTVGGALSGLATPSDLFAAIMKSGTIRGKIIKQYNLKEVFGVKTNVEAGEALDGITRITISPEGIISVSITYKDKYLAANIANSYVEELDKFNTETAMTTGKRYRQFIEARLKNTEESLTNAEETLKQFQEENKTIVLDIEIEHAIATVAELKSQIILLEVKRGALGPSSEITSPYLTSINRELRELKRQLYILEFGDTLQTKKEFGAGFSIPFSQLPETSLEYVRLLREVKVQEAVFELLTQQYEQAKIMEAKDTPTVQLLDAAGPPEKKSHPNRRKIALIAFLASLVVNIGLVFTIESYRRARTANNVHLARWLNMLQYLKNDVHLFVKHVKQLITWKK